MRRWSRPAVAVALAVALLVAGTDWASDARGAPVADAPVSGAAAPVSAAATASGYWLLDAAGAVYAFGDAPYAGGADVAASRAVDLEASPDGHGYWVLTADGRVTSFGTAAAFGDAAGQLGPGETATSISAAPNASGLWIFTSAGRAIALGDAVSYGDLSAVVLNGPVLDSVVSPSGHGYYLVASDGGVFAFGDAQFHGSTGALVLNAPVRSLVPDPDGAGYWLVATDGGVFAFDAAYRGSIPGALPDAVLNQPITGMVPYGDGYVMVAADGGVFAFSDRPFAGSLGASPPSAPVVSIAAVPAPAVGPTPPGPVTTTPTTAPTSTTLGPNAGQWFDRIVVIVMENADAPAVLADQKFAAIAALGTRFAGSKAVAHPSQPNYLAMTGGDPFITDSAVHHIAATNVVDLLEPRGITWKAYLEGYPGGCSDVDQATNRGLFYVRRHNPFVSFDDIRTNPARCAQLVDERSFSTDLAAGNLPQYAFYVPDLIHDGHDSSIATAGAWLAGFLQPLLANPQAMAGTLVVVTYDEGSGTANPATQPIYTVAIGSGGTPGFVDPTAIDHYGLLRTVELNWQLGSLGRHDATATPWPLAPRA
jgi:hypothetical protein